MGKFGAEMSVKDLVGQSPDLQRQSKRTPGGLGGKNKKKIFKRKSALIKRGVPLQQHKNNPQNSRKFPVCI